MSITFDRELMQEAVRLAGEHQAYLHDVPERAFEEYKTSEYIKEVCAGYPLRVIDLGMETGLVCLLDTGGDETVALRTDIDAVPTEHGPRHLCGHDAHAASMLGAIHYLCGTGRGGQGDRPPAHPAQNVLFIFQPAEEGTHGAKAMLEHDLMDKLPQRPSSLYGIHNRPEADCGDVIVHRGALMSEKSVFTIRLTGKAGHGSLPHKCVDPVIAAASLVCSIDTVVGRNTDPFMPAICTVNSVRAGEPDNSAPETAVLYGYIRSLDHDTHVRMEERVAEIAGKTASAYGCKCNCVITHMVPAVENSDTMYRKALTAAEAAAGREHVIDSAPSLASEDFAVLGTEIPSFLYWVGSGTPGRDNAPWHDPGFRVDPHYFATAVPLLCASALL